LTKYFSLARIDDLVGKFYVV